MVEDKIIIKLRDKCFDYFLKYVCYGMKLSFAIVS